MSRIQKITGGVQIVAAVTAAALPPSSIADVATWNSADLGAVPEFDLELWADGARALTAATLYGAQLHPLAFADLTVTADATSNEFAATAHGKLPGDGPVKLTTTTTFPGGTDGTTEYYVAAGADANHLKLAPTRLDGILGANTIDLSSAGSGTIKLVDVDPASATESLAGTSGTQRATWMLHGLLGPADDGAVTLTAAAGYAVRCRHTPRAFAYAVTATFGSGSGAVSAAVYPVLEA